MNNLKKAVLERLINFGKKNKRLKTPVMILITLFLILFHGIRNFFMQFKLHPFRRRVLAVSLCVCLVVSSMPAADYAFPVLAAENSEDIQENGQEEIQQNTYSGIREIVSFTELSDEIREQTVVVGTPLESLALPDTLIAVCRMPNENNLEDNTDSDKKQDSEEEDKQTDEGKEENPEGDSDEENGSELGDSDNQTGDESGASDNEGEGKEDELVDSSNAGEGKEEESGNSNNAGEGNGAESGDSSNEGKGSGEEPGDSGNEGEGTGNESGDYDNGDAEKPENADRNNGETSEGSTDEEKGDAAENSSDEGSGEASEANISAGDAEAEGRTDEGNAGNTEAVETQETFTVTLRENYAMPDELPEIKELFYEETSDTSENESGENDSNLGEESDIGNRNEETVETVTIGGITWESMPEYDENNGGGGISFYTYYF